MTRLAVSGGDSRRTEGCLSIVDLNEASGVLSLVTETWIRHPFSDRAVTGKGLTGLVVVGETAWACFSNVIVQLALATGEILHIVEDSSFSDLHHAVLDGGTLLVANTGNETLDRISLAAGTVVSRLDFLGRSLRGVRPQFGPNEDTKPHLHHITSAAVNRAGEILVGLGRQARILNLNQWAWVGPWFGSPVHDVCCTDSGAVFCTNVVGSIFEISEDGAQRAWALADHRAPIGWTRGLAVTNRGLIVGTTAVRESNRAYFQTFVQADVGTAEAGLTWIPFDGGRGSTILFPGALTRKVFAVCAVL